MDETIKRLREIAATSSDRKTIAACNDGARELEYLRDLVTAARKALR